MNLLSRNWWDKLTFQQIQQALVKSSDQWHVFKTGQVLTKTVCLYGLIANPTFSVGADQVQRLSADFEIACNCDRTGKTTGVIAVDLTFVDFNSTSLLFETLTSLSESNNPYIWVKGTVINFSQINFSQIIIRVYRWGQEYKDLEISEDIKDKK